jgi:hypothetical protein
VIDLTPAVNALLALAATAVTAAIPIVVPALMRRLKIANNSDLAARIEAAADAGAGLAYRYAIAHEGGLANIAVQDASLGLAVNHVAQSVPGALEQLGITPDHVQQMVTARLGALLAADPTVTAGVPAVLPAPVQTVKPDPGVAATPGAAEPLSTAA